MTQQPHEPTEQEQDRPAVEAFTVEAVSETLNVSGQQAEALADAFDDVDDLLTQYKQGVDLTDIQHIGRVTRTKVTAWIKREYPEAVRTRYENDDGICLTFTTDHGLPADVQDEAEFYWGFVCPRCDATNPLEGDPDGFAGRPYRCEECHWVALLEGEAVQEFRENKYSE